MKRFFSTAGGTGAMKWTFDLEVDSGGAVRFVPDFESQPGRLIVPEGEPPPAGGVHVVFGLPRDIRFVRGDANSDGAVNIADSVFVLAFLFSGGEVPRCRDAADFDDDGTLTITDPVYLLGALFGTGAPLAPPHPEEGTDPTADALDCRGF